MIAFTAAASASPVIFGTATMTGPFDTTNETVPPLATVPDAGSCEITLPDGTRSSFCSAETATLSPAPS